MQICWSDREGQESLMGRTILKTIIALAVAGAALLVLMGHTGAWDRLMEQFSGGNTEAQEELLPKDSTFSATYFDVGEADCALVECDGRHMLIDGGEPENSSRLYAYLKEHKIRRLNTVVCSHAHADHVGGLAGALRYAKVRRAYAPVRKHTNRTFQNFVNAVERQGKKIIIPSPGDQIRLGRARVEFLGPVDMSLAEGFENNSSIILRIEYGKTSFLFTGDAEILEEASVADAAGEKLRSTVLKASHHGSYTSSTEKFLDKVRPRYCVISVGADNEFEHPHDTTMERLQGYARRIYRTDRDGTVICTSDGKRVTFTTEKGEK